LGKVRENLVSGGEESKTEENNIEKELGELFEMQKTACKYLRKFQREHERKYKN
jgi:hypothetical protein